jgi:hypothetical protein
MSVALNKTICLFIEKHSNISHSIQEDSFYFKSSNFDNLKKFLFKVATTIMNGHQRFLPGKGLEHNNMFIYRKA